MKVLLTASVLGHIACFHQPLINMLKEDGHEVHVAASDNLTIGHGFQQEKVDKIFNIAFHRNPFSLANIPLYRQLRRIIDMERYDVIHCNTPAVGVLTRLAARGARRRGCKVIYTCHGFHFHNTSSRINWLLYYPVERLLSRFCDYLITINKEDYHRAQAFSCKHVRYIPGVGVDVAGIRDIVVDQASEKESLGVPANKLLLLSVGELTHRKNHGVVIRALAALQTPEIVYAIAGDGALWDYLHRLAEQLGVADQVKFLGYRTDVAKLCHAADICVLPSLIEGLGLSGIEALAAGVPLVASNVHGILDYMVDGHNGYTVAPTHVQGFADAIRKLADAPHLRERMKPACQQSALPFDLANSRVALRAIYAEVMKNNPA